MKNLTKNKTQRRDFLKGAMLLGVAPLISSCASATNLVGFKRKGWVKDGVVYTASHWGPMKITIKNGRIVKSEDALDLKVDNSLQTTSADIVYTPTRIKYPMVRKSYLENPDKNKPYLRGADEWVRVSYEEAIKLTAKEIKKTRKQKGNESIFAGSYGWKSSGNMHNCQTLLQRLMGMTGGYIGGTGDYSTGASQVIMPHVMGSIEVYEQQTTWPVVFENTKVVVLWGTNPLNTLKVGWTSSDGQGSEYFKQLKDSNKKIICIDPVFNETCEYLNAQWIAPNPNTDTALMMGIAHSMLKSGKYDKGFLEEYTTGFDKFERYLLGKEDGVVKSAKWASKITGVDKDTIKELADLFYNNRTMLMAGWSMQRQHAGEQRHWMLVTLASMIGQIGLPGGGFGLSYHYAGGGTPTTNAPLIGGMSLGSVEVDASKSWLSSGALLSIPVARIADLLANPGKTIDFNGKKIKYPDIDLVYWAGGNPFHHHQNTNTLLQAWRKPRTVIVNEMYWTATARHADIVFPITTTFERNDITMVGDYSNMLIAPMKQAVKREHQAKDDYDVFSDLAKEFGVHKEYTENKTPMQWIEQFYNQAYEQAKKQNISMPMFRKFWSDNKPLKFDAPEKNKKWTKHADFRDDPIISPLGTPSGLIEIYSKTIEKMKYDDCPAHPTWIEPIEWNGMKNKPAEFAMLSSHPADRLHSQLNNTSLRDRYEIQGREPVWINTKDAKAKGIKDGDIVRVFNKRGSVLAGAVVTDRIKRKSVRLNEGAWYDPKNGGEFGSLCKHGNANVLTIDIPSSRLSNGNIAQTALVNIEKYAQPLPEITIFTPPKNG